MKNEMNGINRKHRGTDTEMKDAGLSCVPKAMKMDIIPHSVGKISMYAMENECRCRGLFGIIVRDLALDQDMPRCSTDPQSLSCGGDTKRRT